MAGGAAVRGPLDGQVPDDGHQEVTCFSCWTQIFSACIIAEHDSVLAVVVQHENVLFCLLESITSDFFLSF